LSLYYYLYYVSNPYKTYLSDSNIGLNLVKKDSYYYLWDGFNYTDKEKIKEDMCKNLNYLHHNKVLYYSNDNYEYLFNWKVSPIFKSLFKKLQEYCIKNKITSNEIKENTTNINNMWKSKEVSLFQIPVFSKFEIKGLKYLKFNLNWFSKIKSNFIWDFWSSLELNDFILKVILLSKKTWLFENEDFYNDLNKDYNLIENYKLKDNNSNYIDLWLKKSFFENLKIWFNKRLTAITNWNWKYTDYEISYLKNYINSYSSYLWYYGVENNIKSLTMWKRNNLEYLQYYDNTNNTPFHIIQFSLLKKLLFNNSSNSSSIQVLPEDYVYINKTIITNIFSKQWFTYNLPVYNEKNENTGNFITILDPKWKSIQYNYCNYIKTNWIIKTEKDLQDCIKFSNDSYLLLKAKKLLLSDWDKYDRLNYMFYQKWFRKYKMFNGFWNKKGLFPYWYQATTNPLISNGRYPGQCVHYITININKKKLYGWNAVDWCKAAKWKEWFKVIDDYEDAKQQIAPWDIIVFDHLIWWKSNGVWHIAMVSTVQRDNNKLKKVVMLGVIMFKICLEWSD